MTDTPQPDTEPDTAAVEAHLAELGVRVMSLDEWARTSCPSLAAEADRIRNANSPADL